MRLINLLPWLPGVPVWQLVQRVVPGEVRLRLGGDGRGVADAGEVDVGSPVWAPGHRMRLAALQPRAART